MDYRSEHDSCGEMRVLDSAYYGVQTLRAKNNFNITGNKMRKEFIESIVKIKKACAKVNGKYGLLDTKKADAIIFACDEVLSGKYSKEFVVDAVQGGAGTSFNMNVNEVVSNIAIEKLGGKKGDYSIISPNDDVNMEQSTNDVIPSAGKITTIVLAKSLIKELKNLLVSLRLKAVEFNDVLKMGRTQLQDAVPMRLGQAFETYCTMLKRDISRIENGLKEMHSINLGGSAIGTSINVKPKYFYNVIEELSDIVGEKLNRCENLFDGTQNIDCFAMFSSTLKVCVLNLSKMCNDLRLLSSGPKTGIGEINLPAKQNGSSIMPGKVNPVIPEVVNQVAFLVAGHDTTIAMASEAGQLELNAFEPVVFYQLFESITAMENACKTLRENCIDGITANREVCKKYVEESVGIVTVLNPYIGYKKSAELAKLSLEENKPIKELIIEKGLFTKEQLDKILDPLSLTCMEE